MFAFRLFIARLLWLGVLVSGSVTAGTIEGRIVSLDGVPLPDAQVRVMPGDTELAVDRHGHFRSDELAAGEYELRITAPGQAAETRPVSLAADGTARLTVRMAGATDLGSVLITASALNTSLLDSVQPVSVLSGDALREQLAPSLGETLENQPGVTATYFGPGASRPVIRGLGGARVRVLSDGIGSLDAASVSPDHAVSVEPLLAERVEIIRGPATLMYGNGAFGGVVNVVDNRIPEELPTEALHGAVEARAATATGERAMVAKAEGAAGRLAWHLDAYTRSTEALEIPGQAESDALLAAEGETPNPTEAGTLENSDSESDGGALGLSWINGENFLGVSVNAYNSNYGIPGHHHHEEPAPGMPAAEEPPVRIDLEQLRYDLKSGWNDPLPGFDRARFRAGYNDYEHRELEGTETGTVFRNRELETRFELIHKDGKGWDGALGLQYKNRDFAALGAEAFVPPVKSIDRGVFLIEEYPLEAWKFALGARADEVVHNVATGADRRYDTQSFSAGTVYRYGEDYTVSLNLAVAERAPTPEELYSEGPHLATQSYERGNAALEPETARNVDLRLRRVRGDWQWTLGLYRNAIADFIYQANTGQMQDSLPVYVYTQGDATFRGVEAESEWRFAKRAGGLWKWRLFGDYTRATLDDGGNLPRIPPLRVGTGLSYEGVRWSAGVSATRYDDQERTAAFELPTTGYLMVDADLSYRLFGAVSEWFVFLRGSNLADEQARRHSSFLKDLAPLPGRSFTLGIRGEF